MSHIFADLSSYTIRKNAEYPFILRETGEFPSPVPRGISGRHSAFQKLIPSRIG